MTAPGRHAEVLPEYKGVTHAGFLTRAGTRFAAHGATIARILEQRPTVTKGMIEYSQRTPRPSADVRQSAGVLRSDDDAHRVGTLTTVLRHAGSARLGWRCVYDHGMVTVRVRDVDATGPIRMRERAGTSPGTAELSTMEAVPNLTNDGGPAC